MVKRILIIDAILSLDENAKVEVTGSDIDTCDIYWESTEISKANIKAEQQRLQEIEDAKT